MEDCENFSIFRADFKIPEVSYCDFVWDNLHNHSHLPGLVCGLTDKTFLHGEVDPFHYFRNISILVVRSKNRHLRWQEH